MMYPSELVKGHKYLVYEVPSWYMGSHWSRHNHAFEHSFYATDLSACVYLRTNELQRVHVILSK